LAKPNYQYEKRQKELAKKRKQEEKRQRKVEQHAPLSPDGTDPLPAAPETPQNDAS